MSEDETRERLSRITALAEHVWENRGDAREFLISPHPLLEGRSPMEAAESEDGARRVESLLMKLEYSLPL